MITKAELVTIAAALMKIAPSQFSNETDTTAWLRAKLDEADPETVRLICTFIQRRAA